MYMDYLESKSMLLAINLVDQVEIKTSCSLQFTVLIFYVITMILSRDSAMHCKNSGVKLIPDWIQYRSNLEWCQFNSIAVLF